MLKFIDTIEILKAFPTLSEAPTEDLHEAPTEDISSDQAFMETLDLAWEESCACCD